MTNKLKGTICGVLSAIFYGTNPVGALVLYADGFNSSSVLFYRFSIATLLLGALLLAQRKSFRITRKEFCIISVLGLLFAVSALSLYMSFHFMAAGIASTLLFVYPVMVAVLIAHHGRLHSVIARGSSAALSRRRPIHTESGGRNPRSALLAHLRLLHHRCQSEFAAYVVSEAHFLCVTRLHVGHCGLVVCQS